MIIQFIGLPGAGKTTIADAVRDRTNALHINADDIRAGLNKDLYLHVGICPIYRSQRTYYGSVLAR